MWNIKGINMSSVEKLSNLRLLIIVIITLVCLLPNHKCNSDELNEENVIDSNTEIVYIEDDDDDPDTQDEIGDIPLSRKKRALTFPSGSSLQLAYDQTAPIVSAQLLFTIGVTIALAFELPDKPIHTITDQLRQNFQERLHGKTTPSTTAAPVTDHSDHSDHSDYSDHSDHSDHSGHSRIDYNSNNLKYVYNSKDAYYNMMNKHNYYYGNHGFKDRIDDNQSITRKPTNTTDGDIISKQVVKTHMNKDGKKVITMKIKYGSKKKKLGNLFMRKHHRVYPVFGKRSVDDHLTHEDLFYVDHHRNSRFEVYNKIENFLNGREKDGTGCVLRALCETAQKNQNEEKAPFLIEILRALFTLPHQVMPYKKNSHHVYDDAHSSLTADCAELYPQCKDSIWSPDFRF